MTAQRIETGTTDGDALGFTGDLFSGWLERASGNRLYLHYIISRQRDEGNTQALLRRLAGPGLRCAGGDAPSHHAAHP